MQQQCTKNRHCHASGCACGKQIFSELFLLATFCEFLKMVQNLLVCRGSDDSVKNRATNHAPWCQVLFFCTKMLHALKTLSSACNITLNSFSLIGRFKSLSIEISQSLLNKCCIKVHIKSLHSNDQTNLLGHLTHRDTKLKIFLGRQLV